MNKKLVLIDGHSILNRAFYGVPDFTNSEGTHTNAVFGFLNIMFKIIDEIKPDFLAVAFDVHHPTFRHIMYSEYKGTRKPMLPELREQVPIIKGLLAAMNITAVELPGYEADDILGTLSKQGERENMDVYIVSGDKDLLQIASENITIIIPKTRRGATEIEHYNTKEVIEKYKVTPEQFIDVKALMGDSSDNIPGVPGIGEKTAVSLIEKYGSIESAYANVDEITNKRAKTALSEHYNMAVMSKELATIDVAAPVPVTPAECILGDIYTDDALAIIRKLEFKSMFAKFGKSETVSSISNNFAIVADIAEAEEVFSGVITAGLCGIYIDADEGAYESDTKTHEVYGAAICFDDVKAFYIKAGGFVTQEYLIDKLAGLEEKCKMMAVSNVKIYGGIMNTPENKSIFDVSIAAYLLNPLKDSYDYDDIARDYLDIAVPSRKEIIGKPSSRATDDDNEKNMLCACYTAYVCRNAAGELEKRLKEQGMYELFTEVEMPLAYQLLDMEKVGVKVKKEQLKAYGRKLADGIIRIEKEIYEEVGEEFNINSPKQLGEILFSADKMNIPGGKKTKTGYSTAANVLEKLVDDYPVVAKILEYRQLTKLKSTYADGLAVFIGPDDRIHGKFNQTITATGRISSTEPNLQNIPIRMSLGREIRKVFVPEEGYVFIDADYSQIELRILAHMSGDEKLIEAYSAEQDIHRITASKVFHVPFDEVTETQRRNAKAVNFGIIYGISSFGLSQDLSISRKESGQYIDEYFKTYPGIKEFLEGNVAFAKEYGYVKTMFGRVRPIPEISSGNFMQRSFGERVAMNSPIQGTAADIMKIAMINVSEELKRRNLKSRIVLQVHDELLVETYKPEVDEVKELVGECMRGAASLKVPLAISMETGDNWFDAH